MSLIATIARRAFALPARPLTRLTSTATPPAQTIDDVNQLFAEARLSLQDAIESKGTVYFTDDYADAKEATETTLAAFDALLAAAAPDARRSLVEANRPKMAQLAEEFRQLQHELIHDD